jgi:hypothetical protein
VCLYVCLILTLRRLNLFLYCWISRHFVAPYNKLAEKTSLTVLANQNKRPEAQLPTILFTAINCVEFANICSKEDVHGYPTIIPMNIKKATGKSPWKYS